MKIILGELISTIRNGTTSQQLDHPTPFPVTRIETISEGVIDFSRVKYLARPEPLYLLRTNDILYSHINSIKHMGKVAFYDGRFPLYHGMNLMLLRPNEDKVHSKFLFAFLASEFGRAHARKECKSAINQASLGQADIKSLKIYLPPLPEQRRIAEILDKIDEAIQKTEVLISKLKAMKQGLLHDLLIRGLDKNGKLRDPKAHPEQFKDSPIGLIPKSWVVSCGMDITELITKGESPNWQGFGYENEGVLFITSENVRDGFLDVSYPKFISPKFDHKLKRSKLKSGDVLINLVGASIGRSCLFQERFGPANINQAVCLLRLRNNVKPGWIINYLQLPRVISRLLGEQVETARANVSLTQISDFQFPIPPPYEQTDVAIMLSAQDARIRTEEQYRDKLKLQKKGLMHDLLTGKVRVKV